MSKEQKEGILIATVSIIALLILALLTVWGEEFSEAAFYFNGFETKCRYEAPNYTPGEFSAGACYSGIEYKYGFSIKFRMILIFFLPIISYGILRAFGIIRRLFQFEEKVFKFIDE